MNTFGYLRVLALLSCVLHNIRYDWLALFTSSWNQHVFGDANISSRVLEQALRKHWLHCWLVEILV